MTVGTFTVSHTLKEHEAAKWLDADHLEDVAWLASDLDLLPAIRKILLSPKL